MESSASHRVRANLATAEIAKIKVKPSGGPFVGNWGRVHFALRQQMQRSDSAGTELVFCNECRVRHWPDFQERRTVCHIESIEKT